MSGTLYIVSTPIGNYGDLTFRAIRTLKESDFIVCEEYKFGRRLLTYLKIEKELLLLNEHNEKENTTLIIQKLLESKNISLVSDAGTPIFSDPGKFLIQSAINHHIKISPIPGTDSLIPAVVTSGFDVSRFYYAGWLSQKREKRLEELSCLKNIHQIIVIMETPYRLKSLIKDISEIFDLNTELSIACDLTTQNEKFIRGKIIEILTQIEGLKEKFEFVIVLNNCK